MARNEWIMRLKEQVAEVDMAIMTATTSELQILEAQRHHLYAQLDKMRLPPVCMAA